MPATERRDFVELSEDLSGSPLWNPDLAPTPLARRTWSTCHIAALWIGMSVVITTCNVSGSLPFKSAAEILPGVHMLTRESHPRSPAAQE